MSQHQAVLNHSALDGPTSAKKGIYLSSFIHVCFVYESPSHERILCLNSCQTRSIVRQKNGNCWLIQQIIPTNDSFMWINLSYPQNYAKAPQWMRPNIRRGSWRWWFAKAAGPNMSPSTWSYCCLRFREWFLELRRWHFDRDANRIDRSRPDPGSWFEYECTRAKRLSWETIIMTKQVIWCMNLERAAMCNIFNHIDCLNHRFDTQLRTKNNLFDLHWIG